MEISEEELQAKIDEAVNGAIDGLKKKNNELTRRAKTLQGKVDIYDGIDLEDLQGAKTRLEELERAKAQEEGNFNKIIELEREARAKLEQRMTRAQSRAERMAKDNALNDALASVNITDHALAQGARALLREDLKVEETDDELLVTLYGKPVSEGVKEFADGDIGKRYVTPPSNGGAGAHQTNGGGGPGGSNEWDQYFKAETWSDFKQAELRKADPVLYEELSKKYAGELARLAQM